MKNSDGVLTTPDGRHIVVRGRLWRTTNPHMPEDERKRLVSELMSARRAIKEAADDPDRLRAARKSVDAAKVARGPVLWTDGASNLNRHMARTTEYAGWYAAASSSAASQAR